MNTPPNYTDLIDIDSKFQEIILFFEQYNDEKTKTFARKLRSVNKPYIKLHLIFQATFFIPDFEIANTKPAQDFTQKYLKPSGMHQTGNFLLEWTSQRYIQLILYTMNYKFYNRD